jgi:hypothetical protein
MEDVLENIALRDNITMIGIVEVEYKTRPLVPNNIYN